MDQRRADFDRFVADSTGALLAHRVPDRVGPGGAEDLVQETLFEVARRWPRVRRMERPLAYARRILVNRAVGGAGRRARHRQELSGGSPPTERRRRDSGAGLDEHDRLESRPARGAARAPRGPGPHGGRGPPDRPRLPPANASPALAAGHRSARWPARPRPPACWPPNTNKDCPGGGSAHGAAGVDGGANSGAARAA